MQAEASVIRGEGGSQPRTHDPSGNPLLLDAGRWLTAKIKDYSATKLDGVNPDIKCALLSALSSLLVCI